MGIVNKNQLDELKELFRSYPQVIVAYFYGSRITGHAHAKSDLDLAVVVDGIEGVSYGKLCGEISKIIDKFEVDVRVVTEESGVSYLFEVVKTGRCIYEQVVGGKAGFEANVLINYYDSAHRRKIYGEYTKLFFERAQA